MHAWGLRLRRVLRMLAIAHPPVLPSAMRNDVGTLVAIISQLNTQPACAPVNASMAASRLATHDSGSGWFATPFLCDSFIHDSTPVYPGALRILLKRGLPVLSETFDEARRCLPGISLVTVKAWSRSRRKRRFLLLHSLAVSDSVPA